MANKRISELSAITGANLADTDLFVVVDVSDTTMASSGTNKKITMAELAKDSALTDNLIAKTTLTTDGDVLTRAAGAPARITRSDLAQDSAFSSRYVPKSGEVIFIPPSMMAASTGSPTLGAISGAVLSWSLDDATLEVVTFTFRMPSYWTTFHADLHWCRVGASAGDAFIQSTWGAWSDGEVSAANAAWFGPVNGQAYTAPAQLVTAATRIRSDANPTPDTFVGITIGRAGGDAADTLAGDIAILGMTLTRAS